MRILIHSVPPWATSGYGHQCRIAAHALQGLGHEVAVSAYAGCHEEREFEGIPILPTGGKPYGNGVIAANYRHWDADLLILFTDPWVIDPAQLNGLAVMPWMPVDSQPLSSMIRQWLGVASQIAVVHPVAMSEHGQRMLAEHGWAVPVVPHATEFAPSAELRARWRREHNVPDDVFLAVKVGVNDSDDRKSFEVTMLAFEQFVRGHKKAGLFLHTEAQADRAANLAAMAASLNMGNRVVFCDEDRRATDRYGQEWMRSLYCAADVLDATSKGEGFGCPVIDAMACGTPVIATRNSAMPEKVSQRVGWLVSGQRTWARHHNAWWVQPDVHDLTRAYEKAAAGARAMRSGAARAGAMWSPGSMAEGWRKALSAL